MKEKNRKISYLYIISLVTLAIYPLRHVSLGVDMWDGGYNYANFAYPGLEYMDPMWYFATWGANALGSFLRILPGGGTMLGMNVYTGLIVSVMGVGTYLFCIKKMCIPPVIAFMGELLALALCWNPTASLYNYLTYGFLLAGIMLLYYGLTAAENKYLVFAGILLGLNVWNRFSNLVQAALIVTVWYYGFLSRKKWKMVLRETGFCVLGYVGAFAVFWVGIALTYGFGTYAESIARLFDMTQQATDYKAGSMLIGMVWAYYDSSYYIKRFVLALAVALAGCLLLPKKWQTAKWIFTGMVTLALMNWLLRNQYCTADFTTYNSVYYPCILIFAMAILLSLSLILDKRREKQERLQALLVLLLITITSLGGNNAIYSSMNNLFLVMPLFFHMAYRFCREKKQILFFPFQMILAASILLLFIQGMKFGMKFVYEEATGGRDFGAKVNNVPVLKGMHTNEGRAAELEALYGYLRENDLQEKECILYGDIPGLSYYMELVPAVNIWSDLRSYHPLIMQGSLQEIALLNELGVGEFPLVILHTKYAGYYSEGDISKLPAEESTAQKLKILCGFMVESGYSKEADFVSENYAVYVHKS